MTERIETVNYEGRQVEITTDAGRTVSFTRRTWKNLCEMDSPEDIRQFVLLLADDAQKRGMGR